MGASVIQRDTQLRQTPGGLVLPLPSPLLAMLPPALQGLPMQYWLQPINWLNLIHNTTIPGQFVTDSSHYLAAWYGCISVRSSDNQTDRPNEPLFAQITDTHNLNYNPAQTPIDVRNFLGSAQLPAVWPAPLIVPPNSGLVMQLTNNDNVNALNVQVVFVGVLITAQ